MDQPIVLFLLRAIHIGVGVFWIGSVLLVTFYLLPAARATGAAGGRFSRRSCCGARRPST